MDDNTRVVYTHTGTESLRGQEQRESTTGSMSGGLSLEPSAPTPHASGSSFASRHSRAAAAAASSTSESTPVLVAPPLGPSSTLSSTAAESRGSSSLPSAVATSSAGGQPRLDAMVANASEPVLRSSIAPVTTIATDTSNLPNVHEERQFPPLQAAVATSSAAEIEATLPPGVGASTTSSNPTFNRLVDPAGPPPSRVSALTVAALAAQIRPPLTYESALATLLVRELQEAEPLLSTQTTNHELSLALLAVPDDGAFRALVQLSAQELSSLVTKLVRHARRAVATIARDEAGSRSEPEHILQASRRLWAVVQQELQIEQSVAEVLRIVVHHRGVGADAGAAHSIVSYALSEGLFEADACAAAVLTCGSAYEFQAVLDDSVQGAQYPNQLELLYRVSLEVLSGEGRPDDLDECVRRIRTLFLDTLRAGPPAPSYVDYPQSLSGCDVAASTVPLRGSVRQGAHEVSTQDSTLRSAIRPTNNGSTPRQLTFDSAFHSSAPSRHSHVSNRRCAHACARARCSHRIHQCCSRGHHTSVSSRRTTKYASPSPSLSDCGRVAHFSAGYASRSIRESDRYLHLSCCQRGVESYSARPGSAPRRYARGHRCAHASSTELRQRKLSCGFCCSSVHPLSSSC